MYSMYRQLWALCLLGSLAVATPGADEPLRLTTRARVAVTPGSNLFDLVEKEVQWEPRKTALVICDMWDKHWCQGATRRVAEMAPRMNQVVQAARARGVLIIHCPSDTLKFYADTPQRRLAQSAPVVTPNVPLQGWCSLDRAQEPPLPIDDGDGGCDDQPACSSKPPHPWTRQIADIEMKEGDAITDSAEAYYLMRQRGIENVLLMGVHLNMCVLGRPFGIRQLVRQGLQVALMRDLTDTMYNSRRRPFVPHCTGTDLMIEHVEKYWCPTITSSALLGSEPFRLAEDQRPRVVLMIGEDEYKTWETLPAFAQEELAPRGFQVQVIQQNSKDKHTFPGLVEALRQADVLLVSVRRRALPKDQLQAVRAHLETGKPLLGLRTASHAFAVRRRAQDPPADTSDRVEWPNFDPEVLGGHYRGHHSAGPQTIVTLAPGAAGHPMLAGLEVDRFVGHGSLYRVGPLVPTAKPLLYGAIPDQPTEPLAWTHVYGPKSARVFYTSLGSPEDFQEPGFRRLLLNAITWATR